jgi:hypothetical protein
LGAMPRTGGAGKAIAGKAHSYAMGPPAIPNPWARCREIAAAAPGRHAMHRLPAARDQRFLRTYSTSEWSSIA